MGEHRNNVIAIANRQAQQRVPTYDLGDNISLIEVSPRVLLRGDKVVIAVVAVGGRRSDLVPMEPVQAVLAELGTYQMADIKLALQAAINAPDSSTANSESSTESSTSETD